MHELSVMAGIIEMVEKSAVEHNVDKIRKIRLIVGQMSNAIPDALIMGFDMLKDDKLFTEDAVLEIEYVKAKIKCNECGFEFQPGDGYIFTCSQCKSLRTEFVEGDQLYIDYFEGDGDDDGESRNEEKPNGKE